MSDALSTRLKDSSASSPITIQPINEDGRRQKRQAATGASAAGIRALSTQLIAFYFRAPIKSFFRARFDYTAYARALNPRVQAKEAWSWRLTTPAIIAHAVKQYGWSFIPNQVLPPFLANITVGAVLYTTYLQALATLHEPSGRPSRRVFPPPPVKDTLCAGFIAGAVQSLVAAPLDALQVRFSTNEMLDGTYRNAWHYARHKLTDIGPRGVFAGWSLSFLKDSFGFAVFFSTFETIKSQAYYGFVRRWYADYMPYTSSPAGLDRSSETNRPVIRPHYAMEPMFLLLAGVSASIAQALIQHPLGQLQHVHYGRLESLDYAASLQKTARPKMLSLYYQAYERTYEQCKRQAQRSGGWRAWLYRDMLWSTARSVPSTSAGLIVFELVRRRYATDADVVTIRKDGYDILLS